MEMKNGIIFILIAFIGCSKKETVSFETKISGQYKVISIVSTTSVDLNNDGVRSDNLMFEIMSPHNTINGQPLSFFNFDSYPKFMEVRPLKTTANNVKLIAFNFPEQEIGIANGISYLMWYNRSFIAYKYEIDSRNNNISLIKIESGLIENGKVNKLELLANGNMKLALTKTFFDFKDQLWKEIEVVAIYKKID
jgi:hypothetical protein